MALGPVAARPIGTPAAPVVGRGGALPSQMVGSFQNQQLGGLIAGTRQGIDTTQNPAFAALQRRATAPDVSVASKTNKSVVDSAKRLTQIAQMAQKNKLAKAPGLSPAPSNKGMVTSQNGKSTGYAPTGRAKGAGQVDISATIKIGNVHLRADAATEFQKMNAALKQATGKSLGITEGWRSYDRQVELYKLYKSGRGNVAAKPGTSNHGRGTAVDINGYGNYNSPQFQWLLKNARNYGYSWDTGKASGELWHWEYIR